MRKGAPAAVTDFPTVYREIATETLLSVYEAAPARIAGAVEGLGPEELSARPIPGKWSIQEIVCHVADSETCGALRFRLALAQPGSALPAYDQDRFADALAYAEFDRSLFSDTLDLFGRLRSLSARLLRRADASAWGNTGDHREWGTVTLRQLLEIYADHGERHLAQILDRRRAIGRPLSLALLLPERLY